MKRQTVVQRRSLHVARITSDRFLEARGRLPGRLSGVDQCAGCDGMGVRTFAK